MTKRRKEHTYSFARTEADPSFGLTKEAVELRTKEGAINQESKKVEKSFLQILFENTFTVFNIVLFSIAAVFIFFIVYLNLNGYKDVASKEFGFSKFGFLIPAVLNSGIGSYQEFHSKRVLGKLKLLSKAKTTVVREGEKTLIPSDEVVLDDIVFLKAGEQCPADMVLLSGEIRVDEGMLTGESEPVIKRAGDEIFGGSTVLVGSCFARATKVGDDTYAAGLSSKVRELPRHKSELLTSITKIIKFLSFLLLGVTAIVVATLCIKITIYNGDPNVFDTPEALSLASPATWGRIILTAGTYAIGLVPEGLVLLTSVALAISIIKLARQKTLIQELYSLENLSRVNVICLDKTGTLTDGTMKVVDAVYYSSKEEALGHLKNLLGAFEDTNPTSLALLEEFGSEKDAKIERKIPFSSATKHSGIVYQNGDTVLLGATEYLVKDKAILDEAEKYAKEGKRVLALTKKDVPMAIFIIEDRIRPSAKDTLSFFYENGVDVKIISGDNLQTVSKIAEICGVKGSDRGVSLEGVPLEEVEALVEKNVIFARVSPEQKLAIIEALQKQGKKAAMTGDGVNDILALRKADASITFAKATDAAKSCSDVVLLDNDFSHLKEVVGQGRRVVNNIERSATLFLMKTFTFVGLAIFLIAFPKGQMWYSTENIYLMQLAVIGVGGFLLSLESQKEPIRGSFLKNVAWRSIVSGSLMLLSALLPICLNQIPQMWGGEPILSADNAKSMISILTTLAGFVVALTMCMPFTKYRIVVLCVIAGAAILFAFALPTSYIGGRVTSFSMLLSHDGNPPEILKQMFQPWNSEVILKLHDQKACYYLMGGFLLVAIPLYGIIYRQIRKKVEGDGKTSAIS